MPPRDIAELSDRALALMRARVSELLPGDFRPVPIEAEQDFDPTLLRVVQTDRIALFRAFSRVRFECDALGRPVRFEESARLSDPPGPREAAPVEPARIGRLREIAATTGLVSPHARVTEAGYRADGFADIAVEQFVPGFPARIRLLVDPQDGLVAAFQVQEWGDA